MSAYFKTSYLILFVFILQLLDLFLSVIDGAKYIMPSLPFLLIIYYLIRTNSVINIICICFVLGIVNDLIFETTFGSHALVFIITLIGVYKLKDSYIKNYTITQKAGVIFLLMLIYVSIKIILFSSEINLDILLSMLYIPFISTLIWVFCIFIKNLIA